MLLLQQMDEEIQILYKVSLKFEQSSKQNFLSIIRLIGPKRFLSSKLAYSLSISYRGSNSIQNLLLSAIIRAQNHFVPSNFFLKLPFLKQKSDFQLTYSNIEQNQYNFIISSMQKPKQTKLRATDFQQRHDVQQLTNISKHLYPPFTTFTFETSRLAHLPQFMQLINEIKMFNDELEKWKKDQHDIKNFRLTYHLYENLYSRLQFILSFSRGEKEWSQAVNKTMEWFHEEKPKIRCRVREIKASMKCLLQDAQQEHQINKFINSTLINRQMEPYKMMSRTAHPGIFPPKQQLKFYKRKHFLPYSTEQEQNPITVKKSTSASLLSKNKLSKFRMSVGTMMTTASMKQTKDNFKKTVSQFKTVDIPEQKMEQPNVLNEQQQKLLEQNLDELQRENKVEKEELLQNNLMIKQDQYEGPDEEENLIDEEQEQGTSNIKKLYAKDNDGMEIEQAQQLMKENNQSTLRRVLKINQDKIRSKLEDLDLQRNMLNWGKIKGKTQRDQSRKLQTILHANKFQTLEFKRKSVSEVQMPQNKRILGNRNEPNLAQTKEPQTFEMQYRSKSLQPPAIESEIEKMKFKQIFKTYGKYLNHLPNMPSQNNNEEEIRNSLNPEARSMSLTCLSSFGKKQHFSNIIKSQNPQTYNQNLHDEIIRIKTSLAKKGTPIQKGTIYKALSAIPPQHIEPNAKFYTVGANLLSNPFFPKNLGKKKKAKKAK